MSVVIKVENLSKQYRLGEVGAGSMRDDFIRWRYRMIGREDPFLTIGEENDRIDRIRIVNPQHLGVTQPQPLRSIRGSGEGDHLVRNGADDIGRHDWLAWQRGGHNGFGLIAGAKPFGGLLRR